MADREKNKGEEGNTKMWISRERKELFRWIKSTFYNYLRNIILWKKWKIANASFNYEQPDLAKELYLVLCGFFMFILEFIKKNPKQITNKQKNIYKILN